MNRRLFCAGMALITAGCDPFALPEPPQPRLTEEDKAHLHKLAQATHSKT